MVDWYNIVPYALELFMEHGMELKCLDLDGGNKIWHCRTSVISLPFVVTILHVHIQHAQLDLEYISSHVYVTSRNCFCN